MRPRTSFPSWERADAPLGSRASADACLRVCLHVVALSLAACGSTPPPPGDGGADIGARDAAADTDAAVACAYESVSVPGVRGAVTTGQVFAGTAVRNMSIPLGVALSGFFARASFMGRVEEVDPRGHEISRGFVPAVGVHTPPKVRALSLRAGEERVIFVKLDIAFVSESMPFDIAQRMGAQMRGRVVVFASHTHSSVGHTTPNSLLEIGGGAFIDSIYRRVMDDAAAAAQDAIAAERPAQIGIASTSAFDSTDSITRDRRPENDCLAGVCRTMGATSTDCRDRCLPCSRRCTRASTPAGHAACEQCRNAGDLAGAVRQKDLHAHVISIDTHDRQSIAVIPIFGIHGTASGHDNNLLSSDAIGAIEDALSRRTLGFVMHLQGSAGDVAPASDSVPGAGCVAEGDGRDGRLCHRAFSQLEALGDRAATLLAPLVEQARLAAVRSTELELVTRTVDTNRSDIRAREGALEYAVLRDSDPDGVIFAADGTIASPIDEFSAANGAGLCGEDEDAVITFAQLRGTSGLAPYRSCMDAVQALPQLWTIVDVPPSRLPVCEITRTTISALRIGVHHFAMVPGEPTSLWSDGLRAAAPAPSRTIVLGYAQGHVGYLLRAEDWLEGGYEPTINFGGPILGDYLPERTTQTLRLLANDGRDDLVVGTRAVADTRSTAVRAADAPVMRGTVPTTVPPLVYSPIAVIATSQPAPVIPRLGIATFLFRGEDPLAGTPVVTVEKQNGPGWEAVPVVPGSVLLTWTPAPLSRPPSSTEPRTHYWLVTWQLVSGIADPTNAAGLPLGTYRFSLRGDGYAAVSSAFDVMPATLTVSAVRGKNDLVISASVNVPVGYRLLATMHPSTGVVPLENAPVSVQITRGASTTRELTLNENGETRIAGPSADVVAVSVTDSHGNSGSISF